MSKEKKRPADMTIGELEKAADSGDQEAIEMLQRLTDRPEVRAAMDAIIEQTRQLREELQTATAAFSEQMQAHYSEHKAAYDALKDRKSITAFARTLTKEDLDEALVEQEAAAAWKQLQTAKRLEADEAPKKEVDKAYFDVLSYLAMGDAIALYEHKTQQPKTYRTRAKAKDVGAIMETPTALAIPTLSNYQYSMSLYQGGSAYLQPLRSTDGLKFSKGKMYFDGARMQEVSEVELQNMKTKEGIADIDLPLLRTFYSLILTRFEESGFKRLEDILTYPVPVLAEYIGLQSNLNKKDLARVIEKTQSYHNIVGVLHGERNGKPVQSYYPVLNFEGYDDKTNTISFSSPYMKYVIKTVYNLSIRRTKDGKKKLKKSGKPLTLPSHSYLIDSSIAKERNKAAAENVILIVTGIEQAGGTGYHIKASTLVERNPQLAERLAQDPTHKAQLLKRVFTKTWELLRTKTRLQEAYKNIELPDPKNPAFIPTAKNLNTLVLEFPHEGKKEDK